MLVLNSKFSLIIVSIIVRFRNPNAYSPTKLHLFSDIRNTFLYFFAIFLDPKLQKPYFLHNSKKNSNFFPKNVH